jgi:flagellar biosynthesis/type III secretory pathway protein FliH
MARTSSSAVLAAAVMVGLLACSERTPQFSAPASAPPTPLPAEPEDADTYEIGFEAGREQGYADGHQEGFDEGYDTGLDEGRDEGRSEALECVRQHATASAADAANLCE